MSGRSARAARSAAAADGKKPPVQAPKTRQAPRSRLRAGVWALLAIAVAIGVLYAITSFGGNGGGSSASSGGGDYPYAVGSPGPGQPAPPLKLPSSAGGTFDLAAYKGKAQVLLYFQEGLTCQPCWDQMKVIEQNGPKFRAFGIGPIVSVTTDRVDHIRQKVEDEGIAMPVLSDSSVRVSRAWATNQYQMMGMGERNGHSFILVGKDGKIVWRADYGGAPKFTMFVPVDALLRDLRKGIASRA